MTTTLAVEFSEFGGPDVLRIVDAPVPEPAHGEVRVRVIAAGLNPIDYKTRRGGARHAPELPSRTGRELAGIVESVGPGVERLGVGDEVFGAVPVGALAELVAVPEAALAHKPGALAWAHAGGLALAGLTAWDSLASQDLAAGDTIVVTAAAGGVGSILGQLAVARGIRVIGTASEGNHAWLRSRGIEPVAYGPDAPAAMTSLINGDFPLTAAFDQAGDDSVRQLLELGLPDHRINTIAAYSPEFSVRRVGRGAVNLGTLDALAALVIAGTVELPIEATFALSEVRAAFERLESRHLRGKVVVVMADGRGEQ